MANRNIKALYQVEQISTTTKILRNGIDLPTREAIKAAFPDSNENDTFGFKIVGEDLYIRKIDFL